MRFSSNISSGFKSFKVWKKAFYLVRLKTSTVTAPKQATDTMYSKIKF